MIASHCKSAVFSKSMPYQRPVAYVGEGFRFFVAQN